MAAMLIEELARLLSNLIRVGNIEEIDHDGRVVRVKTGGLTTNWLKWHTARAGDSRTWDPPSIGEQVILFAPGGDLTGAFVFASLDSDQNPPPSTSPNEVVREMPDGARVAYDHAAGALSITGIKSMLIDAAEDIMLKAGNSITLDTPQATSTGKHTVEGLLSYLSGMAGENGAGGTTSIKGNIEHTGGNLTSNGIVVHLHIHGGVLPGGADTEVPK